MKNDNPAAGCRRLVILLLAGLSISSGQIIQQPGQQPGSLFNKVFQQEQQGIPGVIPQPVEDVIDETEYIVGPQDVFQFSISGITEVPVPLIVTAEGKLVIPNTGEFHAAGKTLKGLKDEVLRSFKAIKPSLTLLTPRSIIVTVVGAVEKPGAVMAHAGLRVDKAVGFALGSTKEFSRRAIVLRRKAQPDRIVDLERFHAFRRSADNPFLHEGDVVIVPALLLDQASVSVFGAVNAQRTYEYRDGDSLGALIRMAQGLTPNADPSNVELTRFSADGRSSQSMIINATGILNGSQPDIPLENKDRIVVHEKVDVRRDYKVFVRGEVRFPGTYPITRDSTTLSEVIRRAGGFTEHASLRLAEVERKQVNAQGIPVDQSRETQNNLRMTDQLVTPEERAYYELESALRRGLVAVDFVGLFERREPLKDVYLKDGDVIFIPHAHKSVYVYGQVPRPGYVPYKEGADLRYYLDQAGGYGEEAETGGTRVIKGKTREWVDPSDTTIEPGDYVWVPKDIRYPTGYYMNLVSQAASFISVVLSMTVIILQLTK